MAVRAPNLVTAASGRDRRGRGYPRGRGHRTIRRWVIVCADNGSITEQKIGLRPQSLDKGWVGARVQTLEDRLSHEAIGWWPCLDGSLDLRSARRTKVSRDVRPNAPSLADASARSSTYKPMNARLVI